MIHLFTDFTTKGPYLGQMKAVIHRICPSTPVIDLIHDVPAFNIRSAAILLRQLSTYIAPSEILLAVVDPGVGTPSRRPVIVEAGGRIYIGPDNGLFGLLPDVSMVREITDVSNNVSISFHGRDIFAPVTARLAAGESFDSFSVSSEVPLSTVECTETFVTYVDAYGNVFTSLSEADIEPGQTLRVGRRQIPWKATFAEASDGEVFWYVNSIGLVELAANKASATKVLGLRVSDRIS